jgi:DNA-binding NtrC family response regulator
MNNLPVVLVVDDEAVIRDSCRQILERCRYHVETAGDGLEGLRAIQRQRVDLVLLDLKMPGMDGTEFLRRMKVEAPELDVIVITGYSSVGSAVDCMRLGAYDYLPKPFNADSLRLVVGRALERRRLTQENLTLRRRLREENPPDVLLGASPAIGRVRALIERVGPSESTVLILGESGTGKELVARAIHRTSPRCGRPFVAVDCGALVESLCESELFGHVKGAFTGAAANRAGRFELAHTGTLFLDEVADIGPAMQGKLLRVLQEKEVTRVGSSEPNRVDVRVIAATNQDLRVALREGRFREDLYYRLSVMVIEIPPLRGRRDDIPVLAEGLLMRLSERRQLSPRRLAPEAIEFLCRHSWPGNVRELENTLERAMVLATHEEIHSDDLQFPDMGTDPQGDTTLPCGEPRIPSDDPLGADDLRLAALEVRHIQRVLELTGWQLGRAASMLGIDRKTLWRKIKTHGMR